MSYNEDLQSNNAELKAILNAVNSLPNASGGSGGGAEWELLQQVSVPADAEETWDFNITFPKGYDEYLVIANLEATSESSTLVVYPSPLAITVDNVEVGGMWQFWDYYPGTKAVLMCLHFQTMKINGELYARLQGNQHTDSLGKAHTWQSSGWFSYDGYPNTPRKIIGWKGVRFNRLIAPGSGYILLGRKSL